MKLEAVRLVKDFPLSGYSIRDGFCKVRNARRALGPLDLSVGPGEIVGIVGQNGSGKSTLLKLLARTTSPTSGYFTIEGKTAAVLGPEGALHPEFLVEEALHLHAAIYRTAMAPRDIATLLQFTGLKGREEASIKSLSLGMRVRLVLGVALFSNWDWFLVDEVFSSLDLEFRWKCEALVREKIQHGASCLISTHDWEWAARFCSRAICLDSGKIVQDGAAPDVLVARLGTMAANAEAKSPDQKNHLQLEQTL